MTNKEQQQISMNIEFNKFLEIHGFSKIEEATTESILVKLVDGKTISINGNNFDIQILDSENKILKAAGCIEKFKIQEKKKLNIKNSILK